MKKVSEKSNCLDPLVPDVRTAQDWEQECRTLGHAARVMLTVIVIPRRSCVCSTSGEKVGRSNAEVCLYRKITWRALGATQDLYREYPE